MIKVVWLAVDASLRVGGVLLVSFPLPLAYRLQIPPANGKQGPGPKKCTNPADQYEAMKIVHAANTVKPTYVVSHLPKRNMFISMEKRRSP